MARESLALTRELWLALDNFGHDRDNVCLVTISGHMVDRRR